MERELKTRIKISYVYLFPEKILKNWLNNIINISSISGITDKLSCYSFIPTINFKNYNQAENEDCYKVGLTIINSYHEINHTNQSLIFFKGNDKNLFNTPEREGGENFECLLFGKIMGNINLFQSLYLLNENNYDQNVDEFRQNFKNIISM